MKSSQHRKPVSNWRGFNLVHKSFKKLATQSPLSSEVLCISVPPAPFIYREAYRTKMAGNANRRWTEGDRDGEDKELIFTRFQMGLSWILNNNNLAEKWELPKYPSPRISLGVSLSLFYREGNGSSELKLRPWESIAVTGDTWIQVQFYLKLSVDPLTPQ